MDVLDCAGRVVVEGDRRRTRDPRAATDVILAAAELRPAYDAAVRWDP